ncbi:MAG: DUF2384 domain-containing protein [Halothiobacillus sp.]|nr:DUF2384 domain-containing protein [Halothiobacillus sp.]
MSTAKYSTTQRAPRTSGSAQMTGFDFTGERLSLPEPFDTVKIIREGMRYVFVSQFAHYLGVEPNSLLSAIGVRGGTAHRRQKAAVLKPDESDRLYRLMRITALAERVVEDSGKAKEWMNRPNRALGGVTPLSLLDTEAGAEAVEDLLNRLDLGVYG